MDVNAIQNSYHVPPITTPCYILNITTEHGIWQSENPWSQALPLLAMQLAFVIFFTRALYAVLRLLKMPRIIADILAGVIIGPTALGKIQYFHLLFPLRSISLVETVAYWGLSVHMFLMGLEMDTSSVFRVSKKAFNVAAAGILIPFAMGNGLFYYMNSGAKGHYNVAGGLLWGVMLTVTGFPVVGRVLSDTKLFHTEIGRMAMSAAILNDFAAWILLAMLIPFRSNPYNALYSVVSTIGFTAFCVYVVRPVLAFLINRASKGTNSFSNHHLCLIIIAVSLFGVAGDVLGANSIVGAFVFGLILPNRVLASMLKNKYEEFVTGCILPLFFATCGIRIDIWSISSKWFIAIIVIIISCSIKVVSTIVAGRLHNMDTIESVALGVVLNTKGILAIVLLNIGLDRAFLEASDYAVMVISILLMTAAVPLVLNAIYRPGKYIKQYKRRPMQEANPNDELRILVCLHGFDNVSSMINLIDASNATKESPITMIAVHLIQHQGQAAATVLVHNARKSSSGGGSSHNHKSYAYSEPIVSAFNTYENLNDMVSIQTLTMLASPETMSFDICEVAEDKEIDFLILPFHKFQSLDGEIDEEVSNHFRGVNINALSLAPCSVGIFVDKDFGSNNGEANFSMRQILMLFIGGPDDREALCYAWRMARSQGVTLTVVRFMVGDGAYETESVAQSVNSSNRLLTRASYIDRQQRLDDDYIYSFRLKTAGEQSISYEEKVVSNEEETLAVLTGMHHMYDLYIVGKGEGYISPLTAGMVDWCEYSELGAIGDLLVTSTMIQGSVLVVQQYNVEDGNHDYRNEEMTGEQESLRSGRGENWKQHGGGGGGGDGDDDEDDEEPFARRQGRERYEIQI